MNDIAKWLRDNAPADHGLVSGDLMREAADEIERLLAENAAWKHENNLAHAEVERLTAALREIGQEYDEPATEDRRYMAAIARAALEGKP